MKHLLLAVAVLFSLSAVASIPRSIAKMAGLEKVEYVSAAQAREIFDLEGWRAKAKARGQKDPLVLAFVANFFADQIRLAGLKKNSRLDHWAAHLAFVGNNHQWQQMMDAELTAKVVSHEFNDQYEEIGIQAYPALEPRTDKNADVVVVLRKGKVYTIVTQGVDVLRLALRSSTDVEDLIKRKFISSAQTRQNWR